MSLKIFKRYTPLDESFGHEGDNRIKDLSLNRETTSRPTVDYGYDDEILSVNDVLMMPHDVL